MKTTMSISLLAVLAVFSAASAGASLPCPPAAGPGRTEGEKAALSSQPSRRAATVEHLEAERQALRAEIALVTLRLAGAAAEDEGESRRSLEQRLRELGRQLERVEARLAAVKSRAIPRGSGPLDPPGLQPLTPSNQTGQVTSGRDFNPAISVIPDVLYYGDDKGGKALAIAAGPDGFHSHGGEADGHGHGEIERGFNLRELEIAFSGAVDPYFDVWAVLAVGGGEVEAEEAWIQTRAFLPGLQLRAGKFLSGFGYINRQHPHQWDFVDQALAYDLLFGGSLNELGVQATYLPDLPVYLQLGFEALQGDNEFVASRIGPEGAPFFADEGGPRLFTGFARVAPDMGFSSALQAGFSYGRSRLHQELHGEEGEEGDGFADEAFEGTTTFWGLEAVYGYDSGKMYGKGDLTLQGEYVRRDRSLYVVAEGSVPLSEGGRRADFAQDGVYAQAVYGFAPRWTAGFRFDAAGLTNRAEEAGAGPTSLGGSRRYTIAATFNPTEFSRLRIQYSRGDFAVRGGREGFGQLWLQLQVSLGAHGAHAF